MYENKIFLSIYACKVRLQRLQGYKFVFVTTVNTIKKKVCGYNEVTQRLQVPQTDNNSFSYQKQKMFENKNIKSTYNAKSFLSVSLMKKQTHLGSIWKNTFSMVKLNDR